MIPIREGKACPVTIHDFGCGYGKTTKMIEGFKDDERYLVIVPYLTEVKRVIENAEVPFFEPETNDCGATKQDSLRDLAFRGENIVTTHAMYYKLVEIAREGLLSSYQIVVDEVVDPLKALGRTPSKMAWEDIYIANGYVTVNEIGLVSLTSKWLANREELAGDLNDQVMNAALNGSLYVHNSSTFLWCLPSELLFAGKSLAVYTYHAEGSALYSYLKKLGVTPSILTDEAYDQFFRAQTRDLLTIKDLSITTPSPKGPPKPVSFSYSAQGKHSKAEIGAVALALKNLSRSDLKDVPVGDVLITCAKESWYRNGKGPNELTGSSEKPKAGGYAVNSRLFEKAVWIPNTTRGTNAYANTSHLIYLYDKNFNPVIYQWLLKGETKETIDKVLEHFAVAELIQWLYRSRIRRGEPVTLYIASSRMRGLLEKWMVGEL